jgi:hypothetical protein
MAGLKRVVGGDGGAAGLGVDGGVCRARVLLVRLCLAVPCSYAVAHRCRGVVLVSHDRSNVPPTQVVSWRRAVLVVRCLLIASAMQCYGLSC